MFLGGVVAIASILLGGKAGLDYFAAANAAAGGAQTNPLYEPLMEGGTNPLYEGA